MKISVQLGGGEADTLELDWPVVPGAGDLVTVRRKGQSETEYLVKRCRWIIDMDEAGLQTAARVSLECEPERSPRSPQEQLEALVETHKSPGPR